MFEDDAEIITDKLLIHIEMACREDPDSLLTSEWFGCYCCIAIMDSKSVVVMDLQHRPFDAQKRWLFCPRCRADTIIGDFVGYPVTASLLIALNESYYANSGLRSIYHGKRHFRRIRKRILFQNPPFYSAEFK